MMTVTKTKFDNAKIYKIVDNSNENIYIGSTCRTLNVRLSDHKSDYKRFLRGLACNTRSFEIIKNDNYEIKLLETCEVKTKQELFARERFYIENNNCLNKCIPGRTFKEYYYNNKEKIKENKKEYYHKNKEKIKENKKEYYDNNKEKIKENKKEYYDKNKEKIKESQKEYYDDNKENRKEYIKSYYIANKEKLSEKQKQKFECDCRGKFTHGHKARHIKTAKHQKYLETLK